MKTYEKVSSIEKGKTYYGKTIIKYMELHRSELLWALDTDNLYIMKHVDKKVHANNCGTRNPYPDASHNCTCGAE